MAARYEILVVTGLVVAGRLSRTMASCRIA
jgi:hypothetical protein